MEMGTTRSTHGFSDGRVHVTLLDGAFDLDALEGVDRVVWKAVLVAYRRGLDLMSMEAFADPAITNFAFAARLRRREPLASLYADLCRRVALEESGLDALVEDLLPWRPQESRSRYEQALGYHPEAAVAFAA